VRLADAIAGLADPRVHGPGDVEITDLTLDSTQAGPGTLFCCVTGRLHDGHDFAPTAVAAGAPALLVERPLALDVTQVVVPDTRLATALVAATVNGHPSDAMCVVGVTGTNGKTTTTHLLANILTQDGRRTEVLGTLTGARTTPEAPDLQRRLAEWRAAGTEAVAMEVSSHALALRRVDGTRFRVGVFTNLSRDHLDFHHTMEAYFEAKARLFTPELVERAVVNLDSPYGRLLADAQLVPTDGFSLDDAEDLRLGATASRFGWRGHEVHLGLGGEFNVANALAAAGAATAVGVPAEVVAAGLSQPVVVPGRYEPISAGQPFTVVVDYAHTPDGLEQLLAAASRTTGEGDGGRVTVVFGCGGDRDVEKRPLMGEVAARGADRVVLTADNSRGEETEAIIDAIVRGFDRARPRRAVDLVVEPDRRAAIALALAGATPGDLVLLAGKGHESTQEVGGVVTAFDDRDVARDELRRLGWPT
jgi:UDP-N-acetylmuramoyl-L-alanyl-D-glutamate--2,6-diaminopimelate ligase